MSDTGQPHGPDVTDTGRDREDRATPDVPSSTPAQSLPRASPAAAPAADLLATRSFETSVVSELLDRAVHRIFTAGLVLNRAAQRSTPAVAASIEQAISALDDALRDIRADALTASAPDPDSTAFSRERPSP